jgi:hypothetical protein
MRTKSAYCSEMQIKLCGASQSDNRQVGMSGDVLNFHIKPGAWLAGDQRVRQRTRGAAWPDGPWFDPRTTIRGKPLEVDLVRRLASEGAVGAVLVVPIEQDDQLCPHGASRRVGTMIRCSVCLIVRTARSRTAILPCFPRAPKRGRIPRWRHHIL